MSKTQDKAVERALERLKVQHLAEQKFKAWLLEQKYPPKPPKPVPQPMNPARAAAYGLIQVPELGNYSERERVIEHRMNMRERLNNGGVNDGFNEWAYENAAFKKEEEVRIAAATAALKQGHAPGHVAAHFHLLETEVTQMQDQLAGRVPKGEEQ